jgi:8-oxo-dGTP diphosphatase
MGLPLCLRTAFWQAVRVQTVPDPTSADLPVPGARPLRAPELLTIVGAAILDDAGRVLAAERTEPANVAGRWEFPGGKVEAGESDEAAVIRECEEELGVTVELGDRLGSDIPLKDGRAVLRIWLARLVSGRPTALEHAEVRWLRHDQLDDVPWLPADAPLVEELRTLLGPGTA